MTVKQWLDHTLYPGTERNWDDERFRQYVLRRIDPDCSLLDIGAGRGRLPMMDFSRDVAFVAGTDIDPIVLMNPHVHDARVIENGRIPYNDQSFNAVISNNVLEHVDDPLSFFAEVRRVLKPNGLFMAKTPNRRHYVAQIARHTPDRFHVWINSARGREEADTFHTAHLCNTAQHIRRYAVGFEAVAFTYWEGRPEYLRMTPVTYLAGWSYERAVNRVHVLRRMRAVIACTLRRY